MQEITIQGQVSKVDGDFHNWLEVEVYKEGLNFPIRYTVRAPESRYAIGDLVKATGEPGVKAWLSKTGKASAQIVIWNARVEVVAGHTVTAEQAATLLASAPVELGEAPF